MPSYGFAVSITKTSEPGKIPDKSGRSNPKKKGALRPLRFTAMSFTARL